jgi:hypothetical protein
MALDSSNNPHVSYYDASTNSLKYAKKSGGSWTTETVGSMDDLNNKSSIAVDSSGFAYIAYADSEDTPKYATNKSGSWKKRSLELQLVPWENAEYDQFGNFSIALDFQENVHVSYAYTPVGGAGRENTIKYATNKDGPWQSHTVASCNTNCGGFTKIVLASSGSASQKSGIPAMLNLSTSFSPSVTVISATTLTNQEPVIIYQDYASSLYNINYASTQEIADPCSDFTLTLTDDDCDGMDDSEDTDLMDTDGDGIINTDDTDDDGDGTPDTSDPDLLDTDGDGTVDATDPDQMDTDGDGTVDSLDDLPNDATETMDTDSDGTGNNADTDDDGDGLADDADPNPMTFDPDNDHDGIPNCTDDDDDGDGIPDDEDADNGEG